MSEAIKLALQAKQEGDFPFGAVIVKNGQIISSGRSQEVTNHDVTQHAELVAVSRACEALGKKNLSDCIIYASGEPCNMCAAAIFQAKIGKIFIGASRDDLAHFFRKREIGIFQLAKDLDYEVQITTGVLKTEAIRLFDGVKK